MFARLGPSFGWTWQDEQGGNNPVVLADVYRYAGMVTGKAVHDGRLWSRPMGEFEALSLDGLNWKPFYLLRTMVPWEIHVQDVELPVPGTEERAA